MRAAPPEMLSYQGRMVVDGVNFEGIGQFKFALIDGPNGPTLWSNDGTEGAGAEPQLAVPLEVTKGHYGVLLGDTQVPGMTASISPDDFATSDVRLRVWFRAAAQDPWQVLAPDQRIASVGFAHMAATVADGSVTAAKLAPGAVGDAQLPASPTFAGPVFADGFIGSGESLFDLNASQVSQGELPDARLSPNVVIRGPGGGIAANSLDLTGGVTIQGVPFLRAVGGSTTFLGIGAGEAAVPGESYNTGLGYLALRRDVGGEGNVAVGALALATNLFGLDNTSVGLATLRSATTSSRNVALGARTLGDLVEGSGNLAIGTEAGLVLTNGHNNIYVGHSGVARENSTIRIGTPGVHFETHLSGQVSMPALSLPPSGFPEGAGLGAILLGGEPFLHAFGVNNTFLGGSAGNFGLTGDGNTGVGKSALGSNTRGHQNTAVGALALEANGSGDYNTAVGAQALEANSSGYLNTALGGGSLKANTTAGFNTGVGSLALAGTTDGIQNTAVGSSALQFLTNGGNNTALGAFALGNVAIGSFNLALGLLAGGELTNGNHNIYLAASGLPEESQTIRIGSGFQTNTYIAGISGVIVSGGEPVYVTPDGKLGTQLSSGRFKKDIQDMRAASDVLLDLRPVSFRYHDEIDPSGRLQFGLVAEEVEKVAPELVLYDASKTPHSVRYEAVNAMLLNEFQKERREVKQQAETIRSLRGELERVNSRLEQLEALIRQRLEPEPSPRREAVLPRLPNVEPTPEPTR